MLRQGKCDEGCDLLVSAALMGNHSWMLAGVRNWDYSVCLYAFVYAQCSDDPNANWYPTSSFVSVPSGCCGNRA